MEILIIIITLLIVAVIYYWDDLKNVQSQEALKNKFVIWKSKVLELLNNLKSLFARKKENYSKPKPSLHDLSYEQRQMLLKTAASSKKTKSSEGEQITAWERKFLWDGISKRRRVPCINCETEDMYEGPRGGVSTNWRCASCGQGINLTLFGANPQGFTAQNIGIDKAWIRK